MDVGESLPGLFDGMVAMEELNVALVANMDIDIIMRAGHPPIEEFLWEIWAVLCNDDSIERLRWRI